MRKSIEEINERIRRGEATVLTAEEVRDLVEQGAVSELQDVDVVTTATRAVMSGTYAVLSFGLAEKGSFARSVSARINGVLAHVGPCPNERLGHIDLIVFGTAHRDERYGGGHLFRDLVARRSVCVDVETSDGRCISRELTLDEIPHARIFGTRNAFMNYSAFVNTGGVAMSTIFHAIPFPVSMSGASFSGCGILNPLENDPLLETIGVGTRVLINGAEGFVIGTGTRSTPERPNLSGFADMHQMMPEFMGGFVTSAGPECITSWAVPVPVLSQSVFEAVSRPEWSIPLPVMDVGTRSSLWAADYAQVWRDVDLAVRVRPDSCKDCTNCIAEISCPMGAIKRPVRIDRGLCFNCGLCSVLCPEVFRARLGSIRSPDGLHVPVTLRQSDRLRAIRLAEILKERILDGSFRISACVERLSP
ncbi:MAG: methanogenesis marker 16 metalloprotein [Methanothrix sp.]|uniref:methanogenesis marker 16 metalloprotein n=1 Tax=Methanothrix sp. TaxID=90426 RepID=UPI0019B2CC10|nr:methanogenesis marker 16 metalloprotein [Methanothrix sp.]MBC7080094.1 methanogenesis marker 16 metalloprotein [Methanothrix sp.]NPU88280.1 methanogenesis marker 16 metalloprotein [Methanothrix sp.]